MSELPQGWLETEIGLIADIEAGSTPSTTRSEFYRGEIPFFKPGDLEQGREVHDVENTLTEKGGEVARVLPAGSVLVTCIGYLGKSGITLQPSATNQQINAVLPSPALLPEYAYYWSRIIREWLEANASATTVTIINKGRFAKAPILVAPLPEQRRIASKLDSLFARTKTARDELARIPLLIEHYKQAILEKAFTGVLTADWRIEVGSSFAWESVEAGNLFKWGSGKFLPKKNQLMGGIPVYGGNDITGMHNAALVEMPTMVIGRVGAQCGNIHMTKGPAWVTDNAIYATEVAEKIVLGYAYLVFVRANLNADAGGSGQPFVNQTMLDEVVIPLPKPDEQQEIVRRIEAAMEWLNVVLSERGKAAHLLDHLDQGILAKAFRGELVLQNPNEEPAEKLLERIRTERATVPERRGRGRRKAG